ncbi:rubredoxin [Streptomyces sp. NBC_00887]
MQCAPASDRLNCRQAVDALDRGRRSVPTAKDGQNSTTNRLAPREGFPAGTRWARIPDDWSCPDCDAAKVDFEIDRDHPDLSPSSSAWRAAHPHQDLFP